MQRIIAHPHALIEATLFRSREFTAAAVALLLFFIGFAVYLLITVLYLQEFWHYSSALRTGLAIAPAPLTAAVFAVNSGRIAARFGRTAPAIAGALCVAASALFWLIQAPSHPEYAGGFLPGLIIGGVGAGLTQAPLFAAASTLPDDRATTASAVLNMARQAGSAIGVAVLVTLLATPHPHSLVLSSAAAGSSRSAPASAPHSRRPPGSRSPNRTSHLECAGRNTMTPESSQTTPGASRASLRRPDRRPAGLVDTTPSSDGPRVPVSSMTARRMARTATLSLIWTPNSSAPDAAANREFPQPRVRR
ncbi:MAG: family efflux transporter permease subunit [Pseudonocardiales bacterium]|nr:family efflux transporter permease subunit [Pseudonocardiales bacterium]